ncbi:MATE family efflux transporter [Anaerosporobacter faecicola]|uniref:MATE family efflux transporter n=1 Tax=Anaerosporobacter faecicola TaxID=2718714 RepID=UPI00143ADDEC|nr:MATE family efflux transporter [Anaerosporobacter faecicola]
MAHAIERDMTKGNPTRHIIAFALPLLIGNLFQQLYNMVDTIVVGKFIGPDAVASVGTCSSVGFLMFSLSAGIAIGIGIMVAQYFGAGDSESIRRTIANAIYVLSVASVIVGVLGIVLAPPILKLMKTPDHLLADAVTYMRVTCVGIIGIAAYNGVSAIMRALGDSRTPIYFLILASIINVVLDLAFVLIFHLGVFGVGLATIISQFVSAITCTIFAYKKISYFKNLREYMVPQKYYIMKSLSLGIPIALQNSLIAISCIILQSVVNSFGANVMTTFTITGRIEQLIQQPYSSLAMAVTTYTGQNIGANNIQRVKKGYHRATIITLIFSLCMLPVAYIFGASIIRAFVRKEVVVDLGVQALRITSLCYFPLGMIYVPRALLNGAGDTRFAMINGITEVACRIVFANVLTSIPSIGYWGIWITSGATWTVTALVCQIRYFSGIWKSKAIMKK